MFWKDAEFTINGKSLHGLLGRVRGWEAIAVTPPKTNLRKREPKQSTMCYEYLKARVPYAYLATIIHLMNFVIYWRKFVSDLLDLVLRRTSGSTWKRQCGNALFLWNIQNVIQWKLETLSSASRWFKMHCLSFLPRNGLHSCYPI